MFTKAFNEWHCLLQISMPDMKIFLSEQKGSSWLVQLEIVLTLSIFRSTQHDRSHVIVNLMYVIEWTQLEISHFSIRH